MTKRRVVVTGGFGVLGLAVARAFAATGAVVAVVDRAAATAEHSAEFAAPHCALGGVDLTSEAHARDAIGTAAAALGGIDVLVNVAGGFRWQKLEDGSIETWDAMFAINLKTTVLASRAALFHLLNGGSGRIINIGAGAAAKTGATGMGAYTASKAGVHRLTESLADELKDRGITVNAILPGTIDTPQNRADMPEADRSRWVAPADLAGVILFLASPAAQAITGALIPVNGRG